MLYSDWLYVLGSVSAAAVCLVVTQLAIEPTAALLDMSIGAQTTDRVVHYVMIEVFAIHCSRDTKF